MGALPEGIDRLEPGPVLALFLSSVEPESLSGFDRIVVLKAHQRLASFFQARVLEDMASISDLMNQLEADPEIAHEAASAEIGAALRLSRRAADSDLALAIDLKVRLPEVWEALAAGRIDLRRARVIVEGTGHLSVEAAGVVVGRILEPATRLTSGQLRALIGKVCVQADPDDAATRFREAVEGRRVVMDPTVDGTAHLFGLDLPPDRVQAAMRRIADLARSLKTADETRTFDQIRADVFLDLLDGVGHQGRRRRGTVDIQVDLTTLARLADDPGELAGYGPVIADIARQVAENQPQAEWRWTLTHPETGLVVDNGTTRRRPTTRQRRHVEARHRSCVFPGCRMPAADQPPGNGATSRPASAAVFFPDVECQQLIATSTTAGPGPTADPPRPPTWPRCAVTTTTPNTAATGPTNNSKTATTCGPAASATPTPPAATHPEMSVDPGRRQG